MRSLRIVLAEDDPHQRAWLRAVLTQHRIIVREATSGPEVLLLLATIAPVDLIISDERMPMLGGLEVLAVLRRAGLEVPFLLISAFANRDVRSSAASLGAWVLDRPFSATELLACVAALAPDA